MQQASVPPPQHYIDDEIDLMPYIKHVIGHWRWFIKGIVVATVLAVVLYGVLPRQYRAQVTFIIPQSSVSAVSGGLLSAFGFSSSFSSQQSGIYSSYLEAIFNSNRMKLYVADLLLADDVTFPIEGLDKKTKKEQLASVVDALQFTKHASFEQDLVSNVQTVQYKSRYQSLVVPVIRAYIRALIDLNEELNIDAEKLQIVVLDDAEYPLGAFFPNIIKLLVICNVLGVMLVFVWLVAQKVLMGFREPESQV
jgi:uncharacterized protein involved in exopolysaccharide biosynthesis